MEMDATACYQALCARDPRFDGVFFVAVTTTGIYCRPICPARTPGQDRCRFFAQAAQAEQLGFRPCLRCRPELAPGEAPVDSRSRTAWAAAHQIKEGRLAEGESLEDLAAGLGISGRQLRRVVKQEWGVTPVELAQTQRLLLAKQLLTETRLAVTEVAFAAGFRSLRRFNALFASKYGLSPTSLRRSLKTGAGPGLSLTQAYRPPLAWEVLLDFLERHALAGVELISGNSYTRTLAVGPRKGWFQVAPEGPGKLRVELSESLLPALPAVLARVRALFDLDANPAVIEAQLGRDPRFQESIRRCPGLRLPGSVDGFELAWRTVLGQQITVTGAARLGSRLVRELGEPLETPWPELDRLVPTPEQFLAADSARLGELGWLRSRSRAGHALARAFSNEGLEIRPGGDPEVVVARLLELPGIGPWTAHYIAMRGLAWSDGWPHGDGVLKKKLGPVPRPEPGWRPWSAYAAMRLWYGPEETPLEYSRGE